MSVFQSKLDIENLDFNQNLVNEIQALFLATKYNIIFLDCITNGILSFFAPKYINNESNHGCIICNNALSFTKLIKAPANLFKSPPTKDFAIESAEFITKRFKTNIGVSLSGIKNFPNNKDIQKAKVFIGYNFLTHKNCRILECIGATQNIHEQIIQGVFGYLKMMFQKHSNKLNKEKI